MFKLVALLFLCVLMPMTSANAELAYQHKDLRELRKKVNQGDVLAMYWVADKSNVFEEKALWYEKYASEETNSRSTSYLAALYDNAEDYEDYKDSKQSYFWHYITNRLCKKEEYEDKWCADAKKRIPELEKELTDATVSEFTKRAKQWLRDKR